MWGNISGTPLGRSHECSTCPPLVRRDINVSLFSLAALSTSFAALIIILLVLTYLDLVALAKLSQALINRA